MIINAIEQNEPEIEKVISAKRTETKSIFQMIILACQRHKQLIHGAHPRVEMASPKTKKTKIAVDEVLQGRIVFSQLD